MQTAGDQDVGTRCIRTRVTQQIHSRTSQIVAVPDPLQRWRRMHQINQMRVLFSQLPGHVCLDIPRRYCVAPDSMRGQLDTQRRAQHLDCSLGGVVGRQPVAWNGDVGTDRGYQDQTSPGALLLHLLGGKLRGEKCPCNLLCVILVLLGTHGWLKYPISNPSSLRLTFTSCTLLTSFHDCSTNGLSNAMPAAVTLCHKALASRSLATTPLLS